MSGGPFFVEKINISKEEGVCSLFGWDVSFSANCVAVLGFAWKLQLGKCPKNSNLEACFRKTKHANNKRNNKECEERDERGWV